MHWLLAVANYNVALTYIPNWPECGIRCGVKCDPIRLTFADYTVLMAEMVAELQCAVLVNLH